MSDQCEQSGPNGQCHSPQVEGSDFCNRHSDEASRIQGYRLSSGLRERFEHHDASMLETSRDEIVLLRALVEDRLAMVSSPAERLAAFQVVRPALVDIVKCIETLTKLELSNSVVLGKEALAELGRDIVQILTEELDGIENHDSIIDNIARRMSNAIAKSRNKGK